MSAVVSVAASIPPVASAGPLPASGPTSTSTPPPPPAGPPPEVAAGRRRSRGNALKHGLTGAGIALPPKLAEEVQRATTSYTAELRPSDSYERDLVSQIALGTARKKHAFDLECGLLARNRIRDLDAWDDDQDRRAELLGKELPADPPLILLELRGFAAGCDWLIRRWTLLADALDRGLWTDAELELAFDLLGLPPALRRIDHRAEAWRQLFKAVQDDRDHAKTELRRRIDAAIAQLESLADRRFQVETLEYEALEHDLRFDQSPEILKLRRYAAEAERSVQRAHHLLAEHRARKSHAEAARAAHKRAARKRAARKQAFPSFDPDFLPPPAPTAYPARSRLEDELAIIERVTGKPLTTLTPAPPRSPAPTTPATPPATPSPRT